MMLLVMPLIGILAMAGFVCVYNASTLVSGNESGVLPCISGATCIVASLVTSVDILYLLMKSVIFSVAGIL
jgi:hypothetical protein